MALERLSTRKKHGPNAGPTDTTQHHQCEGSVSTLNGLRITLDESQQFEPHSNLTLGMGTSTSPPLLRAYKNNVRIPSYNFVFSSNTVHPVTLSNKKDKHLHRDIVASTLCYEPAFRSTRTIHYRIQGTNLSAFYIVET